MSTLTHHPAKATGTSQADRILRRLQQTPDQWVGMLDLHRTSGSMAVHSRIADLRKSGHRIIQRNLYPHKKSRTVRSQYMLIS